MSYSPIDISSRALLKVGARTISSFTDGTAEAEVAGSLYEICRDALLSAHPWNFATVQRTLAKLGTPPVADYANAYQLPPDCIRALSAGQADRGRGLVYRIAKRQLWTDADDVTLTYIFRPDEADFPPFFVMALVASLSAEFCIPLTDSTTRWEGLKKLAENELRRAKMIDSQEESTSALEDFTLIESRL